MRIPHNDHLGSDIPEAGPERTCILSGRKGVREAFIRLAISPEGLVLPDANARAPGRGAWIAISAAELTTAMAGKNGGKLRGALARSFKGAALTVPDDLPERIIAALTRALTDRLGLAMRAGQLITGSDRIADAARAGKLHWLGHAADAGEDGSRKLDQAWRVGRGAEGSGEGGARLPLDRAALSMALGRDNVVHLALTDAAAAARIDAQLARLARFTDAGPAGGTDIILPQEIARKDDQVQ